MSYLQTYNDVSASSLDGNIGISVVSHLRGAYGEGLAVQRWRFPIKYLALTGERKIQGCHLDWLRDLWSNHPQEFDFIFPL